MKAEIDARLPRGIPLATPSRPRLVVIGNGMAGMRTVEELLKLAPDLYDIAVFGAEPYGNYNRIMLSPVLAGEKSVDDIILNSRSWYEENGIRLHAGDPVIAIDRTRRIVRSKNGVEAGYDRLLIATGSKPFLIPVPGHDLPGVIAFRDIQDVETMLDAARSHRHAVVIGGGLLGLEAANGLMRQGMSVTVVHVTDSLMERQLDRSASALLQQTLERKGLRFLLKANTAEIVGPDRVTAVRFDDGTEVPADLVVMTAGVRPNIDLAKQAGLHCERAIVVDDTLQTYDPRIYAVGECVQHRTATFGLVAPIWDQARVCGAHLAGAGHRRYVQRATATKLKVTGVELYSAGDFIGGPDSEDLVLRDPRRGVYKRLVIEGNRVIGAVLYGDVKEGAWYFDLIQSRTDISSLRSHLLFGKTLCETQAA
ncbi:FAD-dependent oxidoreductase [Paraburkholderia caledonica]|jgi:nitrite reductase (NADH) large subunit|uniref:NAD(P)/FAD-dependent oxidoreductase n=1 Tax=Paraburkholderia caledonica TaxID=134536 RepID=UPI000DEEB5AB|nr:FAD-dependent oxidoreductase [Paraburkholderia caledonica]AXF14117.1 assimilatory nitrite reductase large subunit [Paraburkholderia caledonica]